MINLAEYRELANELQERRMHAIRKFREERANLKQAKKNLRDCEEARKFGQTIAEDVQKTAHEKIASVVSKCLRAVFGKEAYQFEIDFKQSRGKTEARLVFVKGGHRLEEPVDECGGGAVAIAALAAKITLIRLSKPALRPCLILDEILKDLSPKYRPLVPDLLNTLADELGIQIIYSTNEPSYQCGKVIHLGDKS